MATGSLCTVAKRSRMVEDFCCDTCAELKLQESADIYCETCLRFYCKNCVMHHNPLFPKHTIFDRGGIRKWPVPKEVRDFLTKCEVHEGKTLTQFCLHHSYVYCSDCVVASHSQCREVIPISELTNTETTDLQALSMELETVLGEIKSLRSSQEASIQRLQRTYKEHGAFTIEQMLVNINTTIDECGNSYLGTSDENLQLYIKEEMCRGVVSILNVFDESTVKELNEMKEEVISIKESITCSINKCTDLQNDLTQYCDITQKLGDNKELCFIFRIKSKYQIERALNVLGKLDQLLICVQGKSEKNVRISSDSYTPEITAICVLPDGQVIVADFSNNKVKLLNQQYQVVGYLGVSAYPLDMCQITPNCVAVALNDGDDTTHEVQFIAVNNSKLLTRRKFQLQHACTGIAHYHGELFICSGTVLYKYTLSGKQVFPLYEVIQDDTDISCAVSPAGDRLYMTCLHPESSLLTLASDGTLLSVLTESDLAPTYVHVTPEGQVLVCVRAPDGIIQVDREGERQLDILVQEEEDGLYDPLSVCYSRLTSSIIVGRNGNSILVFRAL